MYDDTFFPRVLYTIIHIHTERDTDTVQTIHQPVTPFTFTLIMRVTAELIYTHINDLIWSFVKEKKQKKNKRVKGTETKKRRR